MSASASQGPSLPPEIRLLVHPKPTTLLQAPSPLPSANTPLSASNPKPARYPRFASADLDNLGRRFACKPIARMCPWDEKEGTLVLRFPRGAVSEKALLDAYKATGRFDLVELDGIGFGHGAASTMGAAGGAGIAADPNDPYFNLQYGLRNPGVRKFETTQSKAGADIKAVEAWDLNPGSTGILVAVLDCGLNTKHPDIAARVWVNKGEIAGNGKDDDGNGFIDDVNGWAFANDAQNESLPGSADVSDGLGHGTNVAGIIGAISGNGFGMAGVARCTIMPVKVLNNQNWGYFSWWAAGIRYAVDNGARVINMSMGGPNGNTTVLHNAIDYALQRNVAMVISMGNSRSDVPDYPAAFDGVIAVGATGPDDRYVKSFPWDTTKGSNYGPHISVCAPGNFIYGLHFSDSNEYGTYWSGTSQAAPHVTGVCALLLAQDPARKPADLKRLLEAGADDGVGDPAQDTPGFDVHYGHGRLNAKRSLAAGAAVAIRLPWGRKEAFTGAFGPLAGWRDLLGRETADNRGVRILPGSMPSNPGNHIMMGLSGQTAR
ncbi:MAG: type sorting protein [Fibrobacteres bacterium]|nr:type sorting protein [Fibrobacterota bacterium]